MLTHNKQASLYSILYNKTPENHTLKVINEAIDFSFINELLEDSYSKFYGRPAKEPELMVKLLVLQYFYDLSDGRLIEEASLNLAYLYFLGINPEDELSDPNLLSKFRVHRLGDCLLDEILETINRQCVDKGIIECTGLTIDTTHTAAHTFQATPERVMKKKVYRNLVEENGSVPEEVDQDIPNYKDIVNHREAKQTMKQVEDTIELDDYPKTKNTIENAKEVLVDPKFLQSKGVRSIVDQEARVGHKSNTKRVFGYTMEYMMTKPKHALLRLFM